MQPAFAAAPVADFSGNPLSGAVPFSVDFSDLSANAPSGWAWFFGDEDYTNAWTHTTESVGWCKRMGHSCVEHGGTIYLIGGENINGDSLNDVWKSTDNGASWTRAKEHADWSGRTFPSCVMTSSGWIIVMGGVSDGSSLNDVWYSSSGGLFWNQYSNADWPARYGHSSVELPDGSIVVMGGDEGGSLLNDVWRSTDNGASWTEMTGGLGADWPARSGHTSVALSDGSIVVMGGNDGGPLNDVWRSTDNGASWTEMTGGLGAGWSARWWHTSVALSDDSIVVIGGEDGLSSLNDVWRSTDNGASWTEMTGGPGAEWSARCQFSSIALSDDTILVFGGTKQIDDPCFSMNDVWGSTDNGAHWGYLTESAGWAERVQHTSVTMPDGSIVLMGGWDGGINYMNDVWRSTDNGEKWTLQTIAGADWPGRYGHTSVAVPDGSIVLMGGDDGTLKKDVWRSTDNGETWTLQTGAATWSARKKHTSVALTDGSIVLMGGEDGSGVKNDVWRSTDNGANWAATTESAGWAEREGHSSVVLPDGSIVIMGGYNGASYLDDVWRSTDNGASWTEMTASAGWSARRYHGSVAMPDGSIVLVGGDDGNPEYQNDVWRSTDNGASWTQVYSYALMRRGEHTTVAMPDGSILMMGGAFGDNCEYQNDVWRMQPVGSSLQNPSHTYNTAGTYKVTLQAYNSNGFDNELKSNYITANAVPAAEFTGTPTNGNAPLSVAFTDLSTNTPTGWAWFFGDEDYSEAWTQQTAAAGWTARNGHSSVVLQDGDLLLIGGQDDIDIKNDVWISDDKGATWTQQTAAAGWTPRYIHSCVVLPNGSIVLMGGNDGILRNDVWISVNNGKTWTQQTGAAGWTARSGHSSVILLDGSIVLIGGYDGGTTNDVWRSTDNGKTWTQQTGAAGWTARFGHSSVVLPDGSIVLTGGNDGSKKNDVWRSTDNGATWTQQTAVAGWSAREYSSSVVMPDRSIVLMGGNDGALTDVWRSTDNGVTWTQVNAGADWTARHCHSSVPLPDGSIVLMGGDDGTRKNDVWRMQPVGSSLQNPIHNYNAAGTYKVALQAFNAGGFDSTIKTDYITVTAAPIPTAAPAPAPVNNPVYHSDSSNNPPPQQSKNINQPQLQQQQAEVEAAPPEVEIPPEFPEVPPEVPVIEMVESVVNTVSTSLSGLRSSLRSSGGGGSSGTGRSSSSSTPPAASFIPGDMVPVAAVATGMAASVSAASLAGGFAGGFAGGGGGAGSSAGASWLSSFYNRLIAFFSELFGEGALEFFGERDGFDLLGPKKARIRTMIGFTRADILVIAFGAVAYAAAFMLADGIGFNPWLVIIYIAIIGVGLIAHELAHLALAKKYGIESGIRVYLTGTLVSLGTAIFFGNVFGQPLLTRVKETELQTEKDHGITMLAGPMISILLAGIFLFMIPAGGMWAVVGTVGFTANMIEGVFSMMPCRPMDGKSVVRWNWIIWAGIFIPWIAVYFILYVL